MIEEAHHRGGGVAPAWSSDDLERPTTDRFAAIASALPDHPALHGPGTTAYTFRELHAAVARVANAVLDRLGAGSENVALHADPGVEAVLGLLGIVSAGKAYLPLDVREPAARAAAKVRAGDVRLVVAPRSRAATAAEVIGDEAAVLVLDYVGRGDAPPPVDVGCDDPFNLIHTSGSTGVPKGVVQTHRNVIFDTAATNQMMRVDEKDRFGLVVPLTFGASVSDVMGAFLNGAALHVFDLRQEGVERMARWMRDAGVTVTHMVPTVFRRWMASIAQDVHYPAMRMVKLGGEPVVRSDVDAFRQHFGDDCILRNGLGTTETYLVAAEMIRRGDMYDDAVIPVGHPAPGRRVTVLDPDGHLLPAGEVGQIAVTSRYLSPGYWSDDAATSRVFLSDPDGGLERTYVTGDLGRVRPDGRLEHLGRIDEMVKIRGQRVDVAEVETRLVEHPGIAEAAVVAVSEPSGDTRLVAYVVPVGAALPPLAELRVALREQLPAHMIPTAFVPMEQLPTLGFGKVDRRSLPQHDAPRPDLMVGYVPAQTPDQAQIAACAAALLGVERVGIDDDLFHLGLDSLSAAQLLGRVREALGVMLPIEAAFEAPTVAGLAAWIERAPAGPDADLETILAEIEGLDETEARRLLQEDSP